MNSPTLEAALRYLERGWNVIPVTADKRPLLDTWEEYQHRMATEAEVRAWWGRWPEAGVAVLTGAVSRLVVVDVDSEDGLHAIEPYLDMKTLVAETGGGGRHYYFSHPGAGVPNAVRVLPGVDVRGDGGYVVAPPSRHQSGRIYRWENPGMAPSLLSPGLRNLIQGRGAGRRIEPKDWQTDVTEGGRDQEMTRRCGRLLQVGMPAAEALAVMLAINQTHCKPPLEEAQIKKIVESIAGREAGRIRPGRSAASSFTTLTQHDMLRKYGSDEARWTVAEWLPEASCGLLVAPPGNFKTWILSALAFAVATGRPFLGHYEVVSRGPVLFIQQEDPWWMLQSRIGRMFNQAAPLEAGDGDDRIYELDCRFTREFDEMPVHWYTDRQLNFSDQGVVDKMEQKIAELRPKLVMIDPLYTAAASKDYMAEGAQKMAALKIMRDRYDCSFVVAHHTTVAGSASEDRSSIWGSQFLNAWLEFGWRMPKGDEKGNVIVRHFKSAENQKRIKLKFNITDWSFNVDIDDAPASVSERIEEVILGGQGPGSMRALAEMVGCSAAAVHKVAKKMGLEKNGEGHYKMPAK